MKHKLAILIPYFGDWPEWIDFFAESCRWNPTIEWFLFNDRPPFENRPDNVHLVPVSFPEYREQVSEALGLKIGAQEPYKLCDWRPALPFIHADLVQGFDFVGFGDLDVIYGDIRSFYDDELLSEYDLLSSHPDRVSGHLCVMRNREDAVNAFRLVPGWKHDFARAEHVTFDERAFFEMLTGARRKLFARSPSHSLRCLFREAYSTPGATDHMRWYWRDGRLTNEFYPHHPFMYLHFMSWHSNRWFGHQPGVDAQAPAPWSVLPKLVQIDWRDARKNGFMISPAGIQPIEAARYP